MKSLARFAKLGLVTGAVVILAFTALATPALADSWQAWFTPTKSVGSYTMYGYDELDLSPTNNTCNNDGNGCWQVLGSTSSSPTYAPKMDTQEIGEDRCRGYTNWMNGPNTGHSNSGAAGPTQGPIWYDCSGYPGDPNHDYCLKTYHRAQWNPTNNCNTSVNCILENSWVYDEINDTTTNPGC